MLEHLHRCNIENHNDIDLCMLEDLNQILLAHTTPTIKMNIRQDKLQRLKYIQKNNDKLL